jgi:hypothetical protein
MGGYYKYGFSGDWFGESAEWTYLAQNREKLQAVVKAVIKILFVRNSGNFLTF